MLFVGLLLSCQSEPIGSSIVVNSEKREVQPQLPIASVPFNIQEKIGIAELKADGIGCLRTKNTDLAEKQSITVIVSLSEEKQKVITANIDKKLTQSCGRPASESADKNPGENAFYSFSFSAVQEIESFEIGIAVINSNGSAVIQNGSAEIDLDGDGKPEFFRKCTGFEGVHFTVWSGKPLQGERIWHSFYYVDYETEPSCKKQDLEGLDVSINKSDTVER